MSGKGSSEVTLVRETAGECDFGERKVVVAQQLFRVIDPQVQQPTVRRQAGGSTEGPGEVADGEAALIGQAAEREIFSQCGGHQFLDAALLPGGERAGSGLGILGDAAVGLGDMETEREHDVVKKE